MAITTSTSSKGARGKQPPPVAAEPSRGRVQRFYVERGFGFIRCTEGPRDDVGQDFFFHHSGLEDGLVMEELVEGERVSFTPTYMPKGKRAEHVTRVEDEG